ncbi:hypothetical protein [Foetidibacter luteolus]|uniref:hypothetical protein n=1 Tax=Foetidibacter luteolus TaxID=2608880 RepID=UPI00129BE5A3|nr:hypothetical protein [Foetidibacter luteolus]
MKINFFNEESRLHPFRWFIVIAVALTGWLAYADYSGWNVFSFGNQQQWSASGPGTHHK